MRINESTERGTTASAVHQRIEARSDLGGRVGFVYSSIRLFVYSSIRLFVQGTICVSY